MKISDDMLFSHPVLSSVSDDYQVGLFNAGFEVKIDGEQLTIDASITLNCPDLDQLLEEGAAGCGYFLVCRQTYQNRLVEMSPGRATNSYNVSHFFGALQLRSVVWSREARKGWSSRFLHPEYGGSVDLPAASILAVGEEFRFSVDRERLKPFESIFTLMEVEDQKPGEIRVDPGEDKIVIGVHPTTKSSIDEIRNDPRGRTILLNSVYLPAVMQVLSEMSGNGKSFEDRPWHRIFVAKCDQCGFSPEHAIPLEHAQALLNYPFTQIESQKEKLFP